MSLAFLALYGLKIIKNLNFLHSYKKVLQYCTMFNSYHILPIRPHSAVQDSGNVITVSNSALCLHFAFLVHKFNFILTDHHFAHKNHIRRLHFSQTLKCVQNPNILHAHEDHQLIKDVCFFLNKSTFN